MTLIITGLPVVQQGRKTVGSGVVQLISCGEWWLMINWREGACRFSYFRKLRGGGGNKWKYLLKSELLAILFVMKWSARNNIYKQISILKTPINLSSPSTSQTMHEILYNQQFHQYLRTKSQT